MRNNSTATVSKVVEFPKATITKPDDCLITIDKLIEEVNQFYIDHNGECGIFAEISQDAIMITGIRFKGLEIDGLGHLALRDVEYAFQQINVSICPDKIIKIVRNTLSYAFKDEEPRYMNDYLIDTKSGVIAIYLEN